MLTEVQIFKENTDILLTVHRREGVCFAVNIHGIAKEGKIID